MWLSSCMHECLSLMVQSHHPPLPSRQLCIWGQKMTSSMSSWCSRALTWQAAQSLWDHYTEENLSFTHHWPIAHYSNVFLFNNNTALWGSCIHYANGWKCREVLDTNGDKDASNLTEWVISGLDAICSPLYSLMVHQRDVMPLCSMPSICL